MYEPQPEDRALSERSAIVGDRPKVASWLISMVLHAAVLLALGLALRLGPPQGTGAEPTAEVGIVLKHQEGDREYYEGESNGQDNSAATEAGGPASGLTDIFPASSPVDPEASLPAAMNLIGFAPGEQGVPHAGGAADEPGGRRGGSFGGKGQTSLFGVVGDGRKFVYVFDRSGSMGGSGRNALRAAKRELAASLNSLDTVHQFQIIFYNERPAVFNPSGQAGKLAFATEQTKERARKFIGSITAAGGTRHEDALILAIKLQPDVIFFLTDADEPRMSARQLYDVQRRAAGITIHAVEFGLGAQSDPNNFLVKLARQNGGKHVYVDLSKLFPVGGTR